MSIAMDLYSETMKSKTQEKDIQAAAAPFNPVISKADGEITYTFSDKSQFFIRGDSVIVKLF